MNPKRKTKYFIVGLLVAVLAGFLFLPRGSYEYRQRPLPSDFESYLQMKREASADLKAMPGAEERLIRKTTGKSKIAILYIHGFGACRGEGEEVIEKLADHYNANTYFLRLPGHGTNMEDHASVSYTDYLNEVEDTIRMMPLLGEQVIVTGTSLGGLLGIYLAAKHPEIVSALVISSPFIDFASASARIAHLPGGVKLASLAMGEIRDSSDAPGWEDGWQSCWYSKQHMSAIQSIVDTGDVAARDRIFSEVKVPVLMFYYYKDETHQDDVASVKDMREAFGKFGGAQRNPLDRSVAVADGDHVLFSRYKKTDKYLILKEAVRFLDQVQAASSSER